MKLRHYNLSMCLQFDSQPENFEPFIQRQCFCSYCSLQYKSALCCAKITSVASLFNFRDNYELLIELLIPLTLRRQTLVFKDVEAVLFALCLHLFLNRGRW